MDPIYFTDSYGEILVPVWTPVGSSFVCSIGARTSPVAPKILEYREPVPFLLPATVDVQILSDLDFTKYAVWYNPSEHWKGHIPNSEPRESPFGELEEDPVGICYGESCIGTTEETREVYTNNEDVDQPEIMSEGSFLSSMWVDEIILLGRRLHSICQALATSSDFYRNGGTVGEYPEPLDQDRLHGVHQHSQAAQKVAQEAVRNMLSMLGFIAWFLSVVELHHTRLSGEVYDLGRDVHEFNFAHLINNDVPFHYLWGNRERGDPRFIRFSPEYYHEVANLLTAARGGDIRLEDLPSYPQWKEDLARTDWMGRNLRVGKRGLANLVFKPDWEYEVVDDHGFGARPLYHWNMIRPYAERFKAVTRSSHLTTICTFFRHNPITVDEPAFARPLANHRFALTDFASHANGEAKPEADYYYESSVRVREQVKTLYAPRPGRCFSSFDGRRTDAGVEPLAQREAPSTSVSSMHSSSEEDRVGSAAGKPPRSSWVDEMSRSSPRPRSRRLSTSMGGEARSQVSNRANSLSSRSSRESLVEEFYDAASSGPEEESTREERSSHGIPMVDFRERRDTTPFSAPPSPVDAWTSDFQTLNHALDAISRLAPTIIDVKPRQVSYGDLNWDRTWLKHAFLLEQVEDVLEYALRFGMPFEIYTDLNRVGRFRDAQLSALERRTLPSVYAYGYGDQLMQWSGGGEEQYRVYQGSLHILGRPNAVAFLAMGGLCKFVAEVYAPDLVHRFARGPSPQVAEFVAGKQRWISVEGEAIAHSTDQVSPREVNILLGQHCPHMRGYLSAGAYDFLESLRRKIVDEKKFEWKSNAEWKRLLRSSAKGVWAPAHVPSQSDFDEMNEVLARSFPLDWSEVSLGRLGLPEKFEPRSYRS
ncbi:hypothetical protein B0H14DRAFT_3515167 [Mycena olivaceomarginata]|nr:hypothetical protein B0H14DRAFT_3515167 [Mycena olivaceomarginata]